MNPNFPYDPATPPGVAPATGITVDALLLPPGETDWGDAQTLPCFVYQPVEEVGSGSAVALLPVGPADWRCRFAPDVVGTWRYKVRAKDAGGTNESAEGQFDCVLSDNKGFIRVSETDSRFFEYADGAPFVTPLVNVEQGSPFNTLAGIRDSIKKMGENGVRFARWFPTGEGANYSVAPYGDTIRINWAFGDGWTTADGADTAESKLYSYAPYYYSIQTLPIVPGSRYRLSLRAEVVGDRVLRPQLGSLAGGMLDICSATSTYHEAQGGNCTVKADGWQDYSLEVVAGPTVTSLDVGLRGLYVSGDAPAPFNSPQAGSIKLHSLVLQRDETGNGDWSSNLLTRSDPDSFVRIDQRAAALMDEIMRLSEQVGVYHKLPLFHKNDALLARFQADGSVGAWSIDNFYAAEDEAARWYEEAYVRYFVARWSYSTALHSLELANENNFDAGAQDAAFAIAQVVHDLSPRHILMSNSFWGWWVESFWTDPVRGDLMDYSDKHWYANEAGSSCNSQGECELISNVWDDSAAYVRECWQRFTEYRQAFDYDKPIVRGEGGVAVSATEPQHPDIAQDSTGTYYHKKLWAHVGVLGDTCDGEWYPRLFTDGGAFPNANYDLTGMFAAYERFMAGEPLANGHQIAIGTDLDHDQAIGIADAIGSLRAWGVRDMEKDRILLWIDNAEDTWDAIVEGEEVQPASGILLLAGLDPGKKYEAQWWDTRAGTASSLYPPITADVTSDGIIRLRIADLEHDVAVKVSELHTYNHRVYLPGVVGGWVP